MIGVTSGHFSEGASTITQQLIKNNVFTEWTNETTVERIKRKLQEQYLAIDVPNAPTSEEVNRSLESVPAVTPAPTPVPTPTPTPAPASNGFNFFRR